MYHKLLSVVSSFNLSQVVTEPTRVSNFSSTLIDLIFVSSINYVQSCTTIPALANADHFGLRLIFSTIVHKTSPSSISRKVWRYSLADWNRAAEILDSIDWDSLLPSGTDVDAYWSAWKNYFVQAIELCIPHAVAKVKKNPPWINQGILSEIRKRDILFRILLNHLVGHQIVQNLKRSGTRL